MKNKWPERHYIDLFSGAGFARVRDTNEILAGSPIIAANMVDPFTMLHLCDDRRERIDALEKRLRQSDRPIRFRSVLGDANEVVDDLLSAVPRRDALCVTFVDPYGLHVDFETIRKVAELRSDLIILLADNMDALRNWAAYYDSNPNSNLDRFLGESGWRDVLKQTNVDLHATRLRERYQHRLKEVLGYTHFGHERIRNDHGRDIYTLLFATRNARGLDFWRKAGSIDEGGQRRFF